jgi:antitoxin MazE
MHTEVEIELEGDHLIIRKVAHPRAGWEQSFAEMAQNHDDVLLDQVSTAWDQTEWEW